MTQLSTISPAAPAAAPVADVDVTNHGSIILVRPLSEAAKAWIDENVETEGWQWFGGALSVEPRMCENLLNGMRDAGFDIS